MNEAHPIMTCLCGLKHGVSPVGRRRQPDETKPRLRPGAKPKKNPWRILLSCCLLEALLRCEHHKAQNKLTEKSSARTETSGSNGLLATRSIEPHSSGYAWISSTILVVPSKSRVASYLCFLLQHICTCFVGTFPYTETVDVIENY